MDVALGTLYTPGQQQQQQQQSSSFTSGGGAGGAEGGVAPNQPLEQWTAAEVQTWLQNVKSGRFAGDAPSFAGLDGDDLVHMTQDAFHRRSPQTGDLIYAQVQKARRNTATEALPVYTAAPVPLAPMQGEASSPIQAAAPMQLSPSANAQTMEIERLRMRQRELELQNQQATMQIRAGGGNAAPIIVSNNNNMQQQQQQQQTVVVRGGGGGNFCCDLIWILMFGPIGFCCACGNWQHYSCGQRACLLGFGLGPTILYTILLITYFASGSYYDDSSSYYYG